MLGRSRMPSTPFEVVPLSVRPRRWLIAAATVATVGAAGVVVSDRFVPAGAGTVDGTAAGTDASVPTDAPTQPGAGSTRPAAAPSTAAPSSAAYVPSPAPAAPELAPEDAAEKDSTPAPVADGRAEVAVSYAGWDAPSSSVQVNAYVGSRTEDGGTCTLTLSLGGQTRTATAPASADATTTICELLAVPGSDLPAGDWQAVVRYASDGADGSSEPVVVAVP